MENAIGNVSNSDQDLSERDRDREFIRTTFS